MPNIIYILQKKSIKWKEYFYFCIKISSRLKELECRWKQPQSDISLINWYREKLSQDVSWCWNGTACDSIFFCR